MDVVLAAAGASWEAAVIGEIESSRSLRLVRRCVDVADLLTVAQTRVAAGALVSVDLVGLDADTVFRLERAGVRVAAVETDDERCGGLGIERRVAVGGLDAIALDRPMIGSETIPDDAGRVVTVWGPAGAPGRSTVALGIAAAAAAKGLNTVLVDADTYGGSLAQMLAVLDDVSGLMAACRAANNGRPGETVDHLLAIDPMLRLLTGLPRADMWPQVRPGALDLVLRQLRETAEVVVVDCGFGLEPGSGPAGATRDQSTLQVLEQADDVVVVGRADPVGLARLVRGLHDLREVLNGATPTVVVNGMRPSLGWREREVDATVRRLTGTTPSAFLPFDQPAMDLALMSGRTVRQVAPSSPFVSRIEVLAGALLPRGVVATSSA